MQNENSIDTNLLIIKKLEEQMDVLLQQNEHLNATIDIYKHIVENSPNCELYCNNFGELLFVSPSILFLTGYTSEDFQKGIVSIEKLLTDDCKYFAEEYNQAIKNSNLLNDKEIKIEKKSKEIVYICLSINSFKTVDGVVGSVVVLKDITQQKQQEKELLNNKKLLDSIINNLPVGLQIFDNKGFLIRVNNKFKEILGNYRNLDDSPNFNIHTDQHSIENGVSDFFRTVYETQTLHAREYKLLQKDKNDDLSAKNSIFLHEIAFPIIDLQNNLVAVISLLNNITEKKNADTALKESEIQFRRLLDLAPVAIAVHSGGRFKYCNKSTLELFGAKKLSDILGLPFSDIIHPDSYESVYTRIMDCFVKNELSPFHEEKFFRLDKTEIDVELAALPIVYKGKRAMQVIIKDITERKKAEKELKAYNVKLTELNYTKDKLFSIISHDLRNPFNQILNLSEFLTESLKARKYEDAKLLNELIFESSKNTFTLLENLLQWSRTQTGKINFVPQWIILEDLIKYTFGSLNFEAGIKNIEVETLIEKNFLIYADKDMMEAILRNILSNAIKFTPIGGKVSIQAFENTENFEILIIDTGIGISPENLETIFNISKGFTTFGTANERGSGLGLIICKEFVEKHNGVLNIESEVNKGTKIQIIIPKISINATI